MSPLKNIPKNNRNSISYSKVVYTGRLEDTDKYLLTKTIASELGVTFDEAKQIIDNAPQEIFTNIPDEAAEIFAEKIREVGGLMDVLPMRMGPFCEFHPHKRARAKCKSCKIYICESEILDAGKKLYCPDCYDAYRAKRRIKAFTVLGVLILLGFIWTIIQPTVMRVYRGQTHQKGVNVLIVAIADRMDSSRINLFNDLGFIENVYQGSRFWDIPTIFNREYQSYTHLTQEFMKVSVVGVYETDPDFPVPTSAGGLGWTNFFRRMDSRYDMNLDAFYAVVFVYLVTSQEAPKGTLLPDLLMKSGNLGVYMFPADQIDLREHYLAGLMYSIGSLMGGTNKSDYLGVPIQPYGYPTADYRPDQPTGELEIMAGYGLSKVSKKEVATDMKKVRIGPKSAWEFGWISSRQMKEAYKAGGRQK